MKEPQSVFVRLVMRLVVFVVFAGVISCAPTPTGGATLPQRPIPLLAYYSIEFDASAWERTRAERADYPQLGRYSSSDQTIMRQHIRWAKEAGIDGFIVGWKNDERLNQRLASLSDVAQTEGFKLVIAYEGLTAQRPLSVDSAADDLALFTSQYASSPVFDMFGKPLVICLGSAALTRAEWAKMTGGHRNHLLILATEPSIQSYRRFADLVDGNALSFMVSLSNPSIDQAALDDMGKAIHAQGGLWIAPIVPGFDNHLSGGNTIVERNDGLTLRRAFDAAIHSSPDALGLVSWNGFSDGTHVEPSAKYGRRYLNVLTDIQTARAPLIADSDSSEPPYTDSSEPRYADSSEPGYTQANLEGGQLLGAGILIILVLAAMLTITRRNGL